MLVLLKKYKEVIMYLIFGVATTLVNWICYAGLNIIGIDMNVSNIMAWFVAVIFAYVTNKLFVFESKSLHMTVMLPEVFKFFGARIVTGLVEIIGLPLLVYLGLNQTIFGVDGFVAKILISVIVIVLNYVFSKMLIFKNNQVG